MPVSAIASDTQVSFIPEVTDGTTPATPAFNLLRVTGESAEVQRKLVFSGELNGKRGAKNYALAAESGAGGFDFEYTDGSFEALMEGALRAAWATDVLVNANTPKPFSLETKFEAGGTDVYKRLRGMQINTLSLNCRAQEIATGSFGFMSRLAEFNNAAIAGATYVAGNSEPIHAGDSIGSIASSGLTFDGVHTLSMQLNNNMKARPVLGQRTAQELVAGELEVTGTIGLYLSSANYNVLAAFQAGTETSLTFRIGTVAGKILEVSLPRIILLEPKPVAESKEGDVLSNLNFRALQASSISGGLIQVTRNI
jgi:hypothetical protein